MKRFYICFVILVSSFPLSALTQKLVLDTLVVPLSPVSVFNVNTSEQPYSVSDERNVDDPALLDYGETSQYIFIPVDQKILTDRPLTDVIQQSLRDSIESGKLIKLGLNHLDFSSQKNILFRNEYSLNASIIVYNIEQPLGELIYDYNISRWLRGYKIKKRYARLMNGFLFQLGSDLNHINAGSFQKLSNFRELAEQNYWMQIRTGYELTFLREGSLLLDGYLYFSYPETKRSWIQSAGTMRYRRMKRFESIEWGMSSDWIMHRLDPDWLFRFKSQLMFGINRWKDMKTFKHELYDALLLDFSASQSVHFNPKNSRSVTLGLGLIENVYYIYSAGIQFDAGLLIQAGVQF